MSNLFDSLPPRRQDPAQNTDLSLRPGHTRAPPKPIISPSHEAWIPQRWTKDDRTLLYVVATAMPLLGGLVVRALGWGDHPNTTGVFADLHLGLLLVSTIMVDAAPALITALICGVLLRSWWTLLIAPVTFFAGVLLWDIGAVVVAVVVASGGPWSKPLTEGLLSPLLAWRVAPAIVGAALGTVLARRPIAAHDHHSELGAPRRQAT